MLKGKNQFEKVENEFSIFTERFDYSSCCVTMVRAYLLDTETPLSLDELRKETGEYYPTSRPQVAFLIAHFSDEFQVSFTSHSTKSDLTRNWPSCAKTEDTIILTQSLFRPPRCPITRKKLNTFSQSIFTRRKKFDSV